MILMLKAQRLGSYQLPALACITGLSPDQEAALCRGGDAVSLAEVPGGVVPVMWGPNGAQIIKPNGELVTPGGAADPTTVRNTSLAGLGTGTAAPVVASDSILQAIEKLQAQITAIGGGGDVVAPTASSAVVQNATPGVVSITLSEAMNTSFTPAASAFTVGGHTVSSVAWGTSTRLDLTVTPNFANGEAARLVGYTQPGSNQARDVAGNLLASFSNLSITNNVGDSTAPTASSAVVQNASPSIVSITLSEAMNTSFTPAASAFSVGGHTVSSVAWGTSTRLDLTVTPNFANGEAARVVGYTQPGSNQARDAAGNLLASFSNLSITNNVADSTAPTASSAVVQNATPSIVSITLSEAMNTSFTPAASAFTVGGHTVSSVAWGTSTRLDLTVTPNFANGEAARVVGYTQPGSNQARDVAGNLLATFSNLAITNNVAAGGSYSLTTGIWDAPLDEGNAFTALEIELGTTSGVYTETRSLSTSATSATVTGLPGPGPWFYRVRYSNAGGAGDAYNEAGPITAST